MLVPKKVLLLTIIGQVKVGFFWPQSLRAAIVQNEITNNLASGPGREKAFSRPGLEATNNHKNKISVQMLASI